MSKNIIFVLMYYRHKFLDLIYTSNMFVRMFCLAYSLRHCGSMTFLMAGLSSIEDLNRIDGSKLVTA
jgi:hypothetical protein